MHVSRGLPDCAGGSYRTVNYHDREDMFSVLRQCGRLRKLDLCECGPVPVDEACRFLEEMRELEDLRMHVRLYLMHIFTLDGC